MSKKPKAPPPSDANHKIYRKTWIDLWHDLQYKKLSVNAQHVYLLLCTGPQTESLPLLQLASPGILETHCPALGYDNIKAGLAELRVAGFADYADDQPVIALPRYAAEERCNSYKVLAGWGKVFARIPDGIVKTKHTPTLRALVDFKADTAGNPLTKTWQEHFGDTVSDTVSDTSNQGSGIRDQGFSNQGSASGERDPDSGESGTRTPVTGKPQGQDGPTEKDFREVYGHYPRKEGKRKGLALCKEKITTWESYWHLYWGVLQYQHEIEHSEGKGGSNWSKQTPRHFDRFIADGAWEEAAERFADNARSHLEAHHYNVEERYRYHAHLQMVDVFAKVNSARNFLGYDELPDTWQNRFFIAVRLDQGKKASTLINAIDRAVANEHLPTLESPPLWDLPQWFLAEHEQERAA